MKIVVTGGARFIGSHVTDALVRRGHHVTVIDNLTTGRRQQVNPRAKFLRADVGDLAVANWWSRWRPAAVFHLAAQVNLRRSLIEPTRDATTNIIGSLKLIELCRRYPVRRFVFSSTGGALYGEQPARHRPTPEAIGPTPLSPYGIAKWTVEQYLAMAAREWRLPYVILRYANVYGPRQHAATEAGVVSIFLTELLAGRRPKIFGDGRQTRDFVFVDDVVRANLAALTASQAGTYNIGTGVATSVNQLWRECAAAVGRGHLLPRHLSAVTGEQRHSSLAWRHARRGLGWRPQVKLQSGIQFTADWFKQQL